MKGVTLVEVIVVVLVIGIVSFMTSVCVRLLNETHRQAAFVQVERDAQIALYNIAKDVRNAQEIVEISSTTLQLRTYDLANGYSVIQNFNLFSPANRGTISYDFQPAAGGAYVRRRVQFPSRNQETKLLKNMLLTPSTVDYIFQSPGGACPCERVKIALRLNPGYLRRSPRVYVTEATVRGFVGS